MSKVEYITNPLKIIDRIISRYKIFNDLSDQNYLKLRYFCIFNKKLNFENPKNFNEKLQYLKLNDRNLEYVKLVDKYEVKKIVASTIGEEYIIPTLGVWEKFDQIDFETLPDQFVLKCTHDSGGNVVCKDKSTFNKEKAKKKIEKCLARNFYYPTREWPYKNVHPRIIAEKYLENSETRSLDDYKVHNFNGEPKIILVCKDRYEKTGLTEDFYSLNWEHLDIKRPGASFSKIQIEKPEKLEEMLEISRRLSEGIPFLRTDFYIVDHRLYIGELTFFPASGFSKFHPQKWDVIFGEWLKL